jgi:hypothetical protein
MYEITNKVYIAVFIKTYITIFGPIHPVSIFERYSIPTGEATNKMHA